MQRHGLADDFELEIELLELTADRVEVGQKHAVLVCFTVNIEEASKRSLDDCRFTGTRALGGSCQSLRNLFSEMDVDSWLHYGALREPD